MNAQTQTHSRQIHTRYSFHSTRIFQTHTHTVKKRDMLLKGIAPTRIYSMRRDAKLIFGFAQLFFAYIHYTYASIYSCVPCIYIRQSGNNICRAFISFFLGTTNAKNSACMYHTYIMYPELNKCLIYLLGTFSKFIPETFAELTKCSIIY